MTRGISLRLAIAMVLSAVVTGASGGVIRVPVDYPTIQGALDAAWINDTVLVAPGTYVENITWPILNGIVLLSELGPDSTAIDGSGLSCTITMSRNIDTTTVIDGFTICNGAGDWGGGISCYYNSSPHIRNNVLVGNNASYGGGGISCVTNASPAIENNMIVNNTAADGGGISCSDDSSPRIRNNTISNNSSSGYGGGIRIDDSAPIIENCRIVTNTGVIGGGIEFHGNSFPLITGNMISGNTADFGAGIYCACTFPYPPIRYNNIYANNGYGVYNGDPSYTAVATYDWWGDSTGPYHPTLNPGGLGDTVGDYVDFIPWLTEPVGVEEIPEARSRTQEARLSQNYPNPFSYVTSIPYQIPDRDRGERSSLKSHSQISLKVYDLAGRLLRTLVDGDRDAGYYTACWDGKDEEGRATPSGTYLCRLRVYPEQRRGVGSFAATRKLILLR